MVRQKQSEITEALAAKVVIGRDDVTIARATAAIAEALGARLISGVRDTIELISTVRVRRSGMAMKLVKEDGLAAVPNDDRALLRLILQGRGWWAELRQGQINVTALAERQECTPSYITRVLRLAFLAPSVVEASRKIVATVDHE